MNPQVLVVTADENHASNLGAQLGAGGFDSIRRSDVAAALDYLESHTTGLCLSDAGLAQQLLEQRQIVLPPLVVVDEAADLATAVSLVRMGARDYIGGTSDGELLAKARRHYRKDAAEEAIFASPGSKRCAELARRVATTDVSVLITGESGSGKEVIARLIHDSSARASGPFVAINCAAIPDNMLEAILFGHVKGAYTGAHQSQPGKFELAQGGTLLLDEISEMPLALQAKLLRVLQEREVERLGARTATAVDVRVIATTNVDVRRAIADGSFREDLYYRLSVFPLALMPLRERAEDISLLAEHFVRKHGSRLGRENMVMTDAARDCLQAHDWPGNVRELENVVQRALVLADGTQIVPADFGLVSPPSESDDSLAEHRHEAEAEMILATLRANNQQRKATAKQLGISERTLRYKLARLKDLGFMEA